MRRNIGIDFLRMILIFTVICIHTAWLDLSLRNEVLGYLPPANACFAFLAGWFLFNLSGGDMAVHGVWCQLVKRFKRLGVPYVIWEGVYVLSNILFDILSKKFVFPESDRYPSIVFWGGGSTHLWFIATLMYAQAALCMVMMVFIVTARRLEMDIRRLARFGFLIIGVSALSIRSYCIESEYLRQFAFMLGYVALGVTLRLTIGLITDKIGQSSLFGLILLFSGVVMAVSCFVNLPELVKMLSWCCFFGMLPMRGYIGVIATKCAGCVMGIYLCHALFTRTIALSLPMVNRAIQNGYVLGIINATVAFMLSLAIVSALKKTKFSRCLGFE